MSCIARPKSSEPSGGMDAGSPIGSDHDLCREANGWRGRLEPLCLHQSLGSERAARESLPSVWPHGQRVRAGFLWGQPPVPAAGPQAPLPGRCVRQCCPWDGRCVRKFPFSPPSGGPTLCPRPRRQNRCVLRTTRQLPGVQLCSGQPLAWTLVVP